MLPIFSLVTYSSDSQPIISKLVLLPVVKTGSRPSVTVISVIFHAGCLDSDILIPVTGAPNEIVFHHLLSMHHMTEPRATYYHALQGQFVLDPVPNYPNSLLKTTFSQQNVVTIGSLLYSSLQPPTTAQLFASHLGL